MARQNQTATKVRSVRIPLDYLRRRSLLERMKIWLTLAAIVAVLGYVGFAALVPSATRHFSPGRLAQVHAMWENRCEVCHQSFVPVSANAWTDNLHAADLLCQNCHRGAEHSPNQIATEVASCAACHRDHQGLNADLSRVADSACTVCHAEIAAHSNKNAGTNFTEPPLVNVTSFVSDHPDFRSAKRDPNEIKFSHSRHMRPGLTYGRGAMLLSDLSSADRNRYRQAGQTDGDLVALRCASCHRLDSSALAAAGSGAAGNLFSAMATGPVRPAGAYMLPISYEQDCRACHELSYVGKATSAARLANRASPQNDSSNTTEDLSAAAQPEDLVPHGWSDEKLRAFLGQVLDRKFIHESDPSLQATHLTEALKQPLQNWRLPNRPPSSGEQAPTVGDYLHGELQAAIKNLRLQCAECHAMSLPPDSLTVQPVSVQAGWLQHASFSHVAHRAVACQSCHGGAYPADLPVEPEPMTTLDSAVFIPGRQLCLKCHSPLQGSEENSSGGARFDCVQCHRYHHGESPWHGLGDPARGAMQRVTIPEFIQGEPRENSAPSAR